VAATGGPRARCPRVDRRRPVTKVASVSALPARVFPCWRLWWQWTTWPRLVMTDFARTARPDLILAGGQDIGDLLGPLATYLRVLEARVGALERRLSAVPLMTAADAARYARLNWRRSCARSAPAKSRWPAMSAALHGSPARPSSAGSLPKHHQRRRLLASRAELEVGRQATLLRRHGNGSGKARTRVIATPSWTPTAAWSTSSTRRPSLPWTRSCRRAAARLPSVRA